MPPREYLYFVSWDRLHRDTITLAENILDSGFKPDVIIGIGQGGIIPATLMYFILPEADFKIITPKVSSINSDGPMTGVQGRRVLLMDDVAITGDSLGDIKARIAALKPAELKTACLYSSLGYKDLDFSVRNLGHYERIVFPWYGIQTPDGVRIYEYKGRFGKHEPI